MKKINYSCGAALLLATNFAFAGVAGAPTQPTCLQTSFNVQDPANKYYTSASIVVNNNCAAAVDLNKASISFASNSGSISSVWTWPFSSSPTTYQGGMISFTLLNQGDQYSSTSIAPGKSVSLNFGINMPGTPFNLTAAQQSLQVIPNGTPIQSNGQINIVVNPTGTTGITGAEAINIVSGSTYNNTINNSQWNSQSTYALNNLNYGTYTISANPIGNYNAVATPATLTVNSSTPQVTTITYVVKPQVGSINVSLPQAPLQNTATSINITVTDVKTSQIYSKTANWNSVAIFSSLPAGDTYSIAVPTVYNGVSYAVPKSIANVNQLPANQTKTVTVSYQGAQPVQTVKIPVNVSGLASSSGTVSFVDTYGNSFPSLKVNNGQSFVNLPLNDAVSVSAVATGLYATVTPQSFTVASGQAVSIQFAVIPTGQGFFAPYMDVTVNANWSDWQNAPNGEPMDLSTYIQATGVKHYNLAFITDAGSCVPAWAGVASMPATGSNPWATPWTDKLRAQGVGYAIAFGGASGTDISANCSTTALTAQYQSIINIYQPQALDFDIEGQMVANPSTYNNIFKALQPIQAQYPNISIILTLPTLPTGLDNNGQAVVNAAKAAGLNFKVNLMAMDYGTPSTTMGANAIQASESLHSFLAGLYPSKTSAQIYQMIGLTPMLGQNDTPGEIFTAADARTVYVYGQQKGLYETSMWSLARDSTSCSSPWASPTCNGTGDAPYTFSKAFMGN